MGKINQSETQYMKRATTGGETRSHKVTKTSNGESGNGRRSRQSEESLDGQPSIMQILGTQDGQPEQLNKGTLLTALLALKKGDFTTRLPMELAGMDGKIADAFNEVVELNQRMAEELARLSRMVGKEGKISQRAEMGDVTGSWKASVDSVNALISDLVYPVSETSRVIGAVAKGDLSQKVAMEIGDRPLAGEFLRNARTVNTMVEQLGSFAAEVTRVAREVGTEGKLGGQAKVRGVAGTWKDLTDSVNTAPTNFAA
jgi:methyl-accepting chemotaxis protein